MSQSLDRDGCRGPSHIKLYVNFVGYCCSHSSPLPYDVIR